LLGGDGEGGRQKDATRVDMISDYSDIAIQINELGFGK